MAKAVVTGATGAIGLPLIGFLAANHYQVHAFYRTTIESKLPAIPNVTFIPISDITKHQELEIGMQDAQVVFHLAAKLHINHPSVSLYSEYIKTNVDGTQSVIRAAKSVGVERLVFFSTINVYGSSKGVTRTFDEFTPVMPDSMYAETKAQAEQIVRTSSIPSVILRLAAVYGPGMKGNYLRMLQAIRRRRFILVDGGVNRRTLVHVDDVCAATLLAAQHPAAIGQIYNVTDGGIHTVLQIAQAMSNALSVSAPQIDLPLALVNMAVAVAELPFVLLRRRPPLSRSLIQKLVEDIAVSGTKLQTQLGFAPHYTLDSGWKDTVTRLGLNVI